MKPPPEEKSPLKLPPVAIEPARADADADADADDDPAMELPLPPPPTSAAMTLEQYRAYVATQAHVVGTVHATPAEEKAERDDKVRRHGWWPCESYKCDGKTLNPKAAEKCEACGALKRLDTRGSTFRSVAEARQIHWNEHIRRR